MDDIIAIHNQGPLITASNYWASEQAAAGYYYLSPNSGCLRLLVPACKSVDIAEMRTAKEVVLTMGTTTAPATSQRSKGDK